MANFTPPKVQGFSVTHAQIAALLELLQPIEDLNALGALAGWDQQTAMPRNAGEMRAHQSTTLQGIIHERLTDSRIGTLLAELEPVIQQDSFSDADRGLIRQTRRTYDQEAKLPAELVKELSHVSSMSMEAWLKARDEQNFSVFAPWLKRNIALQREVADRFGYQESRYDALLDLFEPGLTSRKVEQWFAPVRTASTSLLQRIQQSGHTIDISSLNGNFPIERQQQLNEQVLRTMGYDFASGAIARSVHPFMTSFGSPVDVRLTVRYDQQHLPMSLAAAMHEGGHALYEQGIAPALARTSLAHGVSLGIHESQSRLWENIIGRSDAFWQGHYQLLQSAFPEQFNNVERAAFVQAYNHVEPSFVRVEADEVTYNLHILIRFELEKEMINGGLSVEELPDAWNALYKEYLGIEPSNPVEGVLQDVHWTSNIGYFPTYTLGNLCSAQIAHTLHNVYPDFDERLAAGDISFVREWLGENIHQYGGIYLPEDLLKKVTGETLDPQYFIHYLTEKFERIYDLPRT